MEDSQNDSVEYTLGEDSTTEEESGSDDEGEENPENATFTEADLPIPDLDFQFWIKEDSSATFVAPTTEFEDDKPRFNEHEPRIDHTSTPLQILKSFVTEGIVNEIVEQTNQYAADIRNEKPNALRDWSEVAPDELWLFFGLQLLTGLNRKPSYRDYWTKDELLESPVFSKSMSRNRFESILRCFHLTNNNAPPDLEERQGRLWKLGTFLPSLIQNFEDGINVGEYLCLDESLLQFKGRLSFKQYLPLKRSRFGIKYFALVDCETKYLIKLQIYLGKANSHDAAAIKDFGLAGTTVLELLQGYEHKDHKIIFDNWFNSPKLLDYLARRRTYALGTVRRNRKNLPTFSSKLAIGGVETYFTDTLLFERWRDRREVLMLNSFLSHEMQFSPSTNPNNSRMKPKSVLFYNQKMGGVDFIDQQLSPYESLRKSVKWYKKLALHLIDLAVYNSHIIFNYYNPKKIAYKEFLKKLIREILDRHNVPRKLVGRPPRLLQPNLTTHWPMKVLKENRKPNNSNCTNCRINGKRKATPFACDSCGKRLCIDGAESCFKIYHARMKLNCTSGTCTSGQQPSSLHSSDLDSQLLDV